MLPILVQWYGPALCGGSEPVDQPDLCREVRLETDPTKPCPFTPVPKQPGTVHRELGNSQQVFGTPFGNMPRNLPQDAISNIANVSVMKRLKISERNSFELRFSMLNAFNHPNFTSVDPFVEDAGLSSSFTGFGDPSLTGQRLSWI